MDRCARRLPGKHMAGARITARLSPSATQHTKGGDSTEAVAAFFHIHNCPAPTPEGSRKGRIAVPHGPHGTAIRQGLQGRGMKAKGACLAQAQEKVSLRPAIPMAATGGEPPTAQHATGGCGALETTVRAQRTAGAASSTTGQGCLGMFKKAEMPQGGLREVQTVSHRAALAFGEIAHAN